MQPVSGGRRGLRVPAARPPRSRLHRPPGRDERTAPHGLPDPEPADLPRLGNRLRRHGGDDRQHRRFGRHDRDRRERRVRQPDVRCGIPLRCRGGQGGCRVGSCNRPTGAARRPPVSEGDSRGTRGDLHGRAERCRRDRCSQGRRPAPRRLRHLPRRYSPRDRRLGYRPRVQRHPEVPRGATGSLAGHGVDGGHRGLRGQVAVLVPGLRDDRRLRDRWQHPRRTTTQRPFR